MNIPEIIETLRGKISDCCGARVIEDVERCAECEEICIPVEEEI